jgi:hypothetical protein
VRDVPGGGEQRGSDEVRLLHRRSELGYTDKLGLSMSREPEAVSRHEQDVISQRARRDWLDRRRLAWKEARAAIDGALDEFASTIGTDRALQHSLRGVRRSVDALGRQVAR